MKKMYSDSMTPEPIKYYVAGRSSMISDGRFQYTGFDVIEKATDQVIRRFDTFEEANRYAKTLREGRAFDGWTPAFILRTHS